MTARDVSSRLLLAVSLAAVGCYDVPKPDCGFRCGPSLACPSDYTCADDGRCHLNGSDPSLVCLTPDAMTPDAYSPRVTLTVPAAGEVIDPSAQLLAVFDVDVVGVTVSSFTVAPTGSSTLIFGNVAYDSLTRTASFRAQGNLPPNEMLEMRLSQSISDPLTGQSLIPTTVTFRTGTDTTAPTVIDIDPNNADTNVSVLANVVVAFSEQVTGITGSAITLEKTTPSTPVAGTVFTQGSSGALFDPGTQLEPNTNYTVHVTPAVMDVTGNSLVPFTSTFTTGADTFMPIALTTVPANNGTGIAVNTNISVTFDEPVMNVTTTTFQVEGGTVAGTITMSNGNRTATFDPTANLPAATVIDVTLSTGITDTSGNALAATAFSFTTI